MLNLTRKSGNTTNTCSINAKYFYNNELEPMISDPAPYGGRTWSGAQRLFFNIPDPDTTSSENMMKSQSQMRDFFRYFRPTYEEYMKFIKKKQHPLVEMSEYPTEYGKRNCEYLFELSDNTERSLYDYLRYQVIDYVEGDTKRVDGSGNKSSDKGKPVYENKWVADKGLVGGRVDGSGNKSSDKGKPVDENKWVADKGLVGERVDVYWAKDDKWYAGKVIYYDASRRDREGDRGMHYVKYDDNEARWYNFNKRKCRVIDGETRAPVAPAPQRAVSPERCPSWARKWG
jgi:hypothetical protein